GASREPVVEEAIEQATELKANVVGEATNARVMEAVDEQAVEMQTEAASEAPESSDGSESP
ncbi:MAG: 50S ribosomal protein L17, partial [Tumebacillaceae bacterium]